MYSCCHGLKPARAKTCGMQRPGILRIKNRGYPRHRTTSHLLALRSTRIPVTLLLGISNSNQARLKCSLHGARVDTRLSRQAHSWPARSVFLPPPRPHTRGHHSRHIQSPKLSVQGAPSLQVPRTALGLPLRRARLGLAAWAAFEARARPSAACLACAAPARIGIEP